MQSKVKIIFGIIVALAFFFTVGHFFLVFKGKSIVEKQIENILHKKVTIERFDIKPLFMIEMNNVAIKDFGQIDNISISPNMFGFLLGRASFDSIRIINPHLEFKKDKLQEQVEGAPAEAQKAAQEAPAQANIPQMPLAVKSLVIKNGVIDYADKTIGDNGLTVTVKNLNFSLGNLKIPPDSGNLKFDLTARIPWHKDQEEGVIESSGWLNLQKKNMQAKIKITGIDAVYLYPYYASWININLEKARIKKAKLNFTSDITGKDNDMVAKCHLELVDIQRENLPEGKDESKAEKIAKVVFGLFSAMNEKIVADFTIPTKMDRPEFKVKDIRMGLGG
ncbi:MAG: DUF748 domain-containing protein [Candidatus Omnitrophica bacterium]|jgi:hypothetical protein|nr:DUF748 domain-containing protein [Candidatus Omnitrophota bacterium]